MFNSIKNKIEQELKRYLNNLDRMHYLGRVSPVLRNHIQEFVSRPGKRIRPTLFVLGYLGFSKKVPQGLYTTAVSLEMLHDFMLVHDDIIDKSELRRGRPSLHTLFNKYIKSEKTEKFDGRELALVAGDVLYAMSIHAFLSIKEKPLRKENALKKLIEAAMYTGAGEFIELMLGLRNIGRITKKDIYKIYDFKTALYTFSYPLAIGATLAGVAPNQISALTEYGLCLGRAFQIKDDILGMFSEEKEIGKSALTDLREAKKTLLVWYAYKNSTPKTKRRIKGILEKEKANLSDLRQMRMIMQNSGALDFARREIQRLTKEAKVKIRSVRMFPEYKTIINNYCEEILVV